jgi:hypothetical protein
MRPIGCSGEGFLPALADHQLQLWSFLSPNPEPWGSVVGSVRSAMALIEKAPVAGGDAWQEQAATFGETR